MYSKIVLAALLLFSSLMSIAEEVSPQNLYNKIQEVKVSVLQLNTDFFSYRADESNIELYWSFPKLQQSVEANITFLEKQLGSDNPDLEHIKTTWGTYKESFNLYIESVSFINGNALAELIQTKENLVEELNLLSQNTVDETLYTPSSERLAALNQVELILVIIETYGRFAASMNGQLIGAKKDMGLLCEDFNKQMAIIKSSKNNNKNTLALIRKIESKWKFIESSALNPQKDMVPYLMSRFGKSMLEVLQEVRQEFSA